MTLDLNEVQAYRDFRTDETPRYIDQMPLLLSGKNLDGNVIDVPRIPVQVAHIFERRIHSQKPDWMNNWFDTVDGIVLPAKGAYAEGKFKIRKNSDSLRAVTPASADTLIKGGIVHDSYETVHGVEFIVDKDIIVNRDMTKDEALNNPALLEVLGGDGSFRDAVVDKIFYEGKKQFNYDTMMGIYLPSQLKQAHERAFVVDGLDNWSGLGGRDDLHGGFGRLVGYRAPEAPCLKSSEAGAKNFAKEITVRTLLEETNQTSAYAPDQITKLQNILEQKGYTLSRK